MATYSTGIDTQSCLIDPIGLNHVVGSFALLIVRILEEYGQDARSFFQTQGVAVEQLEDLDYRLSEQTHASLWRQLAVVTDDDSIGLQAGKYVAPKTFHLLSLSMWLTNSAKEGLETLFRYFPLFSTSGRGTLILTKSGYLLLGRIDPAAGVDPVTMDAFCAALISLCRQHYGLGFAPISMKLPRPLPEDPVAYETFFRCPVEFDTAELHLMFSKESLEKRVSSANALYVGVDRQVLEDSLKRLNSNQLILQIKTLLKQNLVDQTERMDRIASRLSMSERTLQRRLQNQGTSFRKLTEQCRKELALGYLMHSDLPLVEIGFQLGFSSYHNFCRAFRRWYGDPPSVFRRKRGVRG